MNYSRYLLGSTDPVDKFISYFKGAMRFSTKWERGISRAPGISVTARTETDRIREAGASEILFHRNDRPLAVETFFFWFAINRTILFFYRVRIFFMNKFEQELFSRK